MTHSHFPFLAVRGKVLHQRGVPVQQHQQQRIWSLQKFFRHPAEVPETLICLTAAFFVPAKLAVPHISFLLGEMAVAQALQTVTDRKGALAIGLAGAGASLLAIRLLLRSRVDRFREVPGSWFLGVLPELGPGGLGCLSLSVCLSVCLCLCLCVCLWTNML